MQNGTATDNYHTHIDTLNTVEDDISKTLATLYTKCIPESQDNTACSLIVR